MFSFFAKNPPDDQIKPTAAEVDYNDPKPLADFFERETGINFRAQQSVIKSKLTVFCKLRDIKSFSSCLDRIKKEPALKQEFINHLTTNETYFFREHQQVREIVAKIAGTDSSVKILSLPCSTGEEPYSIAIELLESGLAPSRFSIVGVDIDTGALDYARKGQYRSRSVSKMPDDLVKRYFSESNDHYTIANEIRALVTWKNINIFANSITELGKFDHILSRNMLIYFDAETKKKAQSILANLLKSPDNPVYYGHADLY